MQHYNKEETAEQTMIYNIDFLIAAIVILLLILWYFSWTEKSRRSE